MFHSKLLVAVATSLTLLTAPVWAGDLEDELMETESILNDSEAAQDIAQETAAILAEQSRASAAQVAEAKRVRLKAAAAQRRADAQIASNEKAIERAQSAQSRATKDIAKAQRDQQKMKEKLAASQARLERWSTTKEETLRELGTERQALATIGKTEKNAQVKAVRAANIANKAKRDLKNARLRVRKALKNKGKSFSGHRKMISQYRDQLHDALKELDRLETAIETDRDFDRRMSQLGRPVRSRTISGLNLPRSGKIKTSSCRLRAEPSTKGDVLGSYKRNKKFSMTYHNSRWFTLIYGGQKAFVSAKCV